MLHFQALAPCAILTATDPIWSPNDLFFLIVFHLKPTKSWPFSPRCVALAGVRALCTHAVKPERSNHPPVPADRQPGDRLRRTQRIHGPRRKRRSCRRKRQGLAARRTQTMPTHRSLPTTTPRADGRGTVANPRCDRERPGSSAGQSPQGSARSRPMDPGQRLADSLPDGTISGQNH